MQLHILEKELSANIEKKYDVYKKICEDMNRGVLTKDEVQNLFSQELQDVFINFQTIPDGIIIPDDHQGHFPNEVVIGWDIWENDGGLTKENFVFGDRVLLVDHYGLKAKIQVTEHLTFNRESRSDIEFSGLGTVEGYTASEPKKIHIVVHNEQIHSLSFIMDQEDVSVFNSFPLWQKALEYRHKFSEQRKKVISDLMHYFSAF